MLQKIYPKVLFAFDGVIIHLISVNHNEITRVEKNI